MKKTHTLSMTITRLSGPPQLPEKFTNTAVFEGEMLDIDAVHAFLKDLYREHGHHVDAHPADHAGFEVITSSEVDGQKVDGVGARYVCSAKGLHELLQASFRAVGTLYAQHAGKHLVPPT